jgi:hypothetical protein
MENRDMVERADKVVNLLKLDELCKALKEFSDADFNAGWNAAKELYRTEPEGPAVSQADGSGEPGPSDVVPKLCGCLEEGPGCQRGYEEEMEARLRDYLEGCNCIATIGLDGTVNIDLCKNHAYLVDDPSLPHNV